jgi:hypothetical protein
VTSSLPQRRQQLQANRTPGVLMVVTISNPRNSFRVHLLLNCRRYCLPTHSLRRPSNNHDLHRGNLHSNRFSLADMFSGGPGGPRQWILKFPLGPGTTDTARMKFPLDQEPRGPAENARFLQATEPVRRNGFQDVPAPPCEICQILVFC